MPPFQVGEVMQHIMVVGLPVRFVHDVYKRACTDAVTEHIDSQMQCKHYGQLHQPLH